MAHRLLVAMFVDVRREDHGFKVEMVLKEVGQALAAGAQNSAVRDAEWTYGDLTNEREDERADLTVAAYVLGEIREAARAEVIERLWTNTVDVCALIEPGTPRGFA